MMTTWVDNAAYYHAVGSPTAEDGWRCLVGYRLDCYHDTAQTVDNQTVTVRSIAIPQNAIFDFHVVAVITNAAMDKGGRIEGKGAIMRGAGNVLRPASIDTQSIKNLGNTAIDVVANTSTQAADIQVSGTTNGAGVVNWRVWTFVRRSV